MASADWIRCKICGLSEETFPVKDVMIYLVGGPVYQEPMCVPCLVNFTWKHLPVYVMDSGAITRWPTS